MRPPSIILSGARCFVGGRFEICSLKLIDGFIREIAPSFRATTKDLVLNLEGTAILPGLINAHDHLEFNLFKKIGTPPYPNYVSWGEDIHKQHKDYIEQVLRVPLGLRLLWGAYKNIFSGATTVVHHNKFYFDFLFGYPVDVLRNYAWIHSLALDDKLEKKLTSRKARPCIIHLAEGVDDFARSELTRLVEIGGLTKHTVLVHGIGLSLGDLAQIEDAGASLVWCPSSNDFLFHQTAPVNQAMGRFRIALGTDSTLTGNSSLFDEIRRGLQVEQVRPLDALAMVTSSPADIFGIRKGEIAEGRAADLLLYDCEEGDPLKGFVDLDVSKIKCLLRNGVPLYGDTSVVHSLQASGTYTSMEVLKKKKMVRGDLAGLMQSISRHLPAFDFNALPIEIEVSPKA